MENKTKQNKTIIQNSKYSYRRYDVVGIDCKSVRMLM